jgi:NitT/TauT family transport system permease protein
MNGRLVLSKLVPPFLTLVIFLGIAEFVVRSGFVKDYIFPAPTQVLQVLVAEHQSLQEAALSTFTSSVAGLGISFVLGSLLSILLSAFSFLRRAIYPYAVFFQTVPIISIAPLLVIWFGFGQPTVIASSFIVSIFPIMASTLLGLQSTDPHLIDLFRLYEAPKKDYLLKLKIPFALPQIFSGLKIAAGLAIVGAIVGEFIAGGGLGGVVDSARTQQRVDLVFAAVLVSSLLGLVFVGFLNYLSWLFLYQWHASEKR